jgi:hypothetical protein
VAARLGDRRPMPHPVEVTDAMELAIRRVHEAMDRVVAAWETEYPDLPLPVPGPPLPSRRADPNPAQVTTRQRAQVACRRAGCLCQQALQARARAKQVHQATREVVSSLLVATAQPRSAP